MQPSTTHAGKMLVAAAVSLAVGWLAASPTSRLLAASDRMSAAQQNALIQKYCAVCHNDAHMNGGLSLQHFDAAHPDPGIAAMIVSKLKAKAMGAAGIPRPDNRTCTDWRSLATLLRRVKARFS